MIDVAFDGLVGWLTINRPERRNALTVEMAEELGSAIATMTTARVLVVTGADGAFCAGADLDARVQALEHGDPFRPAFVAVCRAIAEFPGVVVAAVDGPALGAGTQLAAWCDLRVAGDTAMFGIPAGKLGVHVGADSIARLCAIVGVSAAELLLLGSDTIDADAAHRLGLVQRRAADAQTTAREWAAALAGLAPLTVAGHKRALRALSEPIALSGEARAEIDALEARAFASADFREGLSARAEKRPPKFLGQ
ncbi:MAG: enoyl-CoA hydratase/isomerase family protein [Acidimicrobiia bacterium]